MSDELFDIPESLSPRMKWERELEILCHYADIDEEPWLAVSMKLCKARLKGYDLTEKEKTDVGELFAGYCRLLDEGNMVGYGQTREQAIDDLVKRGAIPSMETMSEEEKEMSEATIRQLMKGEQQ